MSRPTGGETGSETGGEAAIQPGGGPAIQPVRFGTDGIRGVANAELTPELVMAIGRSAARELSCATILVGRDTRRSGPLLQAALSAGLAAEGSDVLDVGILPTPALAWLAAEHAMPAAMISASHNPFEDNGIKLFGPDGKKLSDELEASIEKTLGERIQGTFARRELIGDEVGTLTRASDPLAGYRHHLESCLEHLSGEATLPKPLSGLTIVLDLAHGAACSVAVQVFRDLGAEVHALADAPDGTNINARCGAIDPAGCAAAVVELGADFGLAFDGDADRVMAVDHTGTIVDGDRMLAMFARDMLERSLLDKMAVAVTVMSNLGLRVALSGLGIAVRDVAVGDRHVVEAMEEEGLDLGGEQSGHIVFRKLSTTGDGILTGIVLADLVARHHRSLHDLTSSAMQGFPQELVNVPVCDPQALGAAGAVWEAVAAAERRLGDHGRVLLRASGTEPVVRVMVEALDPGEATTIARELAEVVKRELACAR